MRIGLALVLSFGLAFLSCISSTGCSRANYAILGLLVGEAIYDDPIPENVQPETDSSLDDSSLVDIHIAVDVDNDGASVVAETGGPDGHGSVPVTINVTVSEEHDGMDRQGNGPPDNRPPEDRPRPRQDHGSSPGRGDRQDNQGHDHEAHDGHSDQAGDPVG